MITSGNGLEMPDYVMDVVVYPSQQEEKEGEKMEEKERSFKCQMIEVNPFGAYMSSGAGYVFFLSFALYFSSSSNNFLQVVSLG